MDSRNRLQERSVATRLSEDELVRKGLTGDQDALDTLFARYSRSLYPTALKLMGNPEEAEDALQDGLLSAFRNLPRFEGRSQFSTWLTRIVINAALMRRRRQVAHPALSIEEPMGDTELTLADQLADPALGPEQLYAQKEMREIVQESVSQLPPEMKKAVTLRHADDLSTRQAAKALRIPENTLKSRLRRARLHLAELIKTAGPRTRVHFSGAA